MELVAEHASQWARAAEDDAAPPRAGNVYIAKSRVDAVCYDASDDTLVVASSELDGNYWTGGLEFVARARAAGDAVRVAAGADEGAARVVTVDGAGAVDPARADYARALPGPSATRRGAVADGKVAVNYETGEVASLHALLSPSELKRLADQIGTTNLSSLEAHLLRRATCPRGSRASLSGGETPVKGKRADFAPAGDEDWAARRAFGHGFSLVFLLGLAFAAVAHALGTDHSRAERTLVAAAFSLSSSSTVLSTLREARLVDSRFGHDRRAAERAGSGAGAAAGAADGGPRAAEQQPQPAGRLDARRRRATLRARRRRARAARAAARAGPLTRDREADARPDANASLSARRRRVVRLCYVRAHFGAIMGRVTVVVVIKVAVVGPMVYALGFSRAAATGAGFAFAQVSEVAVGAHHLQLVTRHTYLDVLSTTIVLLAIAPLFIHVLKRVDRKQFLSLDKDTEHRVTATALLLDLVVAPLKCLRCLVLNLRTLGFVGRFASRAARTS
ncbi:solute:proton antiporter [Aureococcus anophagefferens]|nr:solute:proton antiporter [Aureococcus anophagefferens]